MLIFLDVSVIISKNQREEQVWMPSKFKELHLRMPRHF